MTSAGEVAERVGRMLRARSLTLAVAESCTGGLLGHCLTGISGSSDYFLGGVIAYANRIKTLELGVTEEMLAQEGAVSEPVALRMASGICARWNADVGVGITGIAGPEGGRPEKPVGTVFIAVAGCSGAQARCFHFSGDRGVIKRLSVDAALEMLEERLKSKE